MLLLSACVGVPRDPTHTFIAPDLDYAIPPPSALGHPVAARQFIIASYGQETLSFEANLEASDDKLSLVGLDGFGRRAYRIAWRDGVLSFEPAPWLPAGLRAESILADVTLIFWPDAAVRGGLGEEAQLRSAPGSRSIWQDGKEIIRIDYDVHPPLPWVGKISYSNMAFGYRLEIQSVAAEQ